MLITAIVIGACATVVLAAWAAEPVVFRPKPIDDVLYNPHIGFQTFQHFNGDPLFDGKRWTEVGPEDFGFRYRETDLRETGTVLLEAVLKLQRGDLDQAAGLRREKILDRLAKHPVDLPSAGSWFRNLPAAEPGGRRGAAGALLEQAGAKDMSEGDARVFSKHANMIVNTGDATSADVLKLAARMKSAVLEKFGIQLVEEVRYLEP